MASVASRLHAMMWGVFSIGAFIAAFLLPVLIYVNNVAYPLGLWPMTGKDPSSLMVIHPKIASLFIFVTVAGSLFHGIFRFQTTLGELGLKRWVEKIAAAGYAIIGIGILALAYYLLLLNPDVLKLLKIV